MIKVGVLNLVGIFWCMNKKINIKLYIFMDIFIIKYVVF